MNVPILDLQAQYASLKTELDSALLSVAESQILVLGPETDKLERNLAEYCGAQYALGVSSGTDALLLALMALNIGPGDEVIVPTFSFFATAGVVSRLHAVPVFVDIDPQSYNIAPAAVEAHITERTKAIVPVHLYGQSADLTAICAIAARHGIPVIEDAAQAIGAQYKDGRRVGAIGDIGCFSFYPTKNLGAFGDAGLVTTNNGDLYEKMKLMRVHGMEQRYYHRIVGANFRIDAIQSAVLNAKFPHLPGWSAGRRENAALYNRLFMESGLASGIGHTAFGEADRVLLPAAVYQGSGHPDHHIYHQYVIRVQERDALQAALSEKNIGSGIYYPVPFHAQECFAALPLDPQGFPVADATAATVLALPVYPELSSEQIHYVVETIAEFHKR